MEASRDDKERTRDDKETTRDEFIEELDSIMSGPGRDAIFRILMNKGYSRHDVEDGMQDAYMYLRCHKTLVVKYGVFQYFITLATNRIRDIKRKVRKNESLTIFLDEEDDRHPTEAECAVCSNVLDEAINACLKEEILSYAKRHNMSELQEYIRQQEALSFLEFYEQIHNDLPRTTTKMRVYKIRTLLKELLERKEWT